MKYQRLTQRDIIQEGDEYYASFGAWIPIELEFIGKRKGKVFSHYLKMRRHPTSQSSRPQEAAADFNH